MLLEWKLGPVLLSEWCLMSPAAFIAPIKRCILILSGDVSPGCLEGFGQQRLGHPVRGTKSQSDTANAENAPSSSSARAADAPDAQDARGQPGKAAAGGGRLTNRAAGDSAGATTPRARPAQSLRSESFTSGFLRPSPTQPR